MQKSLVFALLVASKSLSAQPFFESNLPIVWLETAVSEIPNEPKTDGTMKIYHRTDGQKNALTDQPAEYDGAMGIEIRGASSSGFPQSPYAIETRESDGSERDVALFGWPEEHDFSLISHFGDKAFSRNPLAFQLFRDMGHWAPRTQLVEVFWNGDYRGAYLFTEKIKRDAGRVAVPKCDTTGGYIFKIDYPSPDDSWLSAFGDPLHPDREVYWVHVYPKAADLEPFQRDWLRNRVFETEKALYSVDFDDPTTGWRAFLDERSLIDYWLVSEVSRNNDGSKKSRYFSKNKNSSPDGGRIKAGPVWDFDWAWKNIAECGIFAATNGSGWSWQINDCGPDLAAPGWYPRLLEDAAFVEALRCRYDELRQTVLKTDRLTGYVDSVAGLMAEAQVRHYQKWPILGQNTGAPEVNFQPTSFAGEVSKLKNWIKKRMTWLDANVPGDCLSSVDPSRPGERLFCWPNPASDFVFLKKDSSAPARVCCSDALGRVKILPFSIENEVIRADLTGLGSGFYFFWIETEKGERGQRTGRAAVLR